MKTVRGYPSHEGTMLIQKSSFRKAPYGFEAGGDLVLILFQQASSDKMKNFISKALH
jgi:hypothetical protein